jgi:cytochrome c oxidase assembly protein subunit 11
MSAKPVTNHKNKEINLGLTAAICAVFVAGMVGMSFAAVPFYSVFCQVTGYGGTTRQATEAPAASLDRMVTVRFDANVANGLGWSFRPIQRSVKVRLGDVAQVAFRAENRGSMRTTGSAVFNVTPVDVGAYFNKIACFCFTEQTLEPGESVDMPVIFFVDPTFVENADLDTTTTITLSYTFYPAIEEKGEVKPVAAATPQQQGNAL